MFEQWFICPTAGLYTWVRIVLLPRRNAETYVPPKNAVSATPAAQPRKDGPPRSFLLSTSPRLSRAGLRAKRSASTSKRWSPTSPSVAGNGPRTRSAAGSNVIEASFATVAPLDRLRLVQERLDLESQLDVMTGAATVDIDALEKEFVANVASYSTRKGISYEAWREIGIKPPCSVWPASTANEQWQRSAAPAVLRRHCCMKGHRPPVGCGCRLLGRGAQQSDAVVDDESHGLVLVQVGARAGGLGFGGRVHVRVEHAGRTPHRLRRARRAPRHAERQHLTRSPPAAGPMSHPDAQSGRLSVA